MTVPPTVNELQRGFLFSHIVLGYFKVTFVETKQGHPTEKNIGKGLECSFLISDIVLWPFNGISV